MKSRSTIIALAGCLALIVCLACFGLGALFGLFSVRPDVITAAEATPVPLTSAPTESAVATPTATNTLAATETRTVEPTAMPTQSPTVSPSAEVIALQPPPEIVQQPLTDEDFSQLVALLDSDFPAHDYFESASRLSSQDLGGRTVSARPFAVGDRQTFVTGEGRQEAELLAVTEHTYFWVDTRLDISQEAMVAAAERFERDYYPEINRLFGNEWRPGVDNDPHFSVLHLVGSTDESELGFFDSTDEYPSSISSSSNEQEIIYLNMESLDIEEDLYFGTLVHEVQHLVHWHRDANEEAWTNEGLSQLTELYLGLDTVDTAGDFLASPGTQLNTWPTENGDEVFAHYGAAYLFMVYLWEQLGEAAIMDLVRHPANGMASVYDVLATYRPDLSPEPFIGSWAVANYLDNQAAGPAFHYENLRLPRPSHAIEVKAPPFESVRNINQFSAQYAELELSGSTTVTFAGDTHVALSAARPHSGSKMWFVPAVDDIDATLTGAFDLSGLDTATLDFWTWYDLEEDFDYGYLSVSTDNGQSWQLLVPENASPGEFGPAFNGRSQLRTGSEDGWLHESLSLTSYAGQQVLIRFEVLTDSAITGAGFAVDDISIPELGYATDGETGEDGWQSAGFVRSGSLLPQRWSLYWIERDQVPSVTPLELNERNQGQWQFEVGRGGGVLVITALTPFTIETASYWLRIDQP